MSVYKGLELIAMDPKMIGKLCDIIGSMPNIDFQTMGGSMFWVTLDESGGWRLQKNKLTDHCRLIDPSNIRKAWGSERAMIKALETLAQKNSPRAGKSAESEGAGNRTAEGGKVFCPNCGEKVPDGRFCKNCGGSLE